MAAEKKISTDIWGVQEVSSDWLQLNSDTNMF